MYRRETRNVSGLSLRPSVHIYFRNERRAWLAARVCRTRSLSRSSRVFLLRLLPRLILMDLSLWQVVREKKMLLLVLFSAHSIQLLPLTCLITRRRNFLDSITVNYYEYAASAGESLKSPCLFYSASIGQWHMIPNYLNMVLLKNLMSRQLVVKEFHSSYENPLVTIISHVNSIYVILSYGFKIHNHDKYHHYLQ